MHLEIYISDQCANCQEAIMIAKAARSMTGLEVTIINLDAPEQTVHPQVVAVPTYVLNGRVISLGNPEREAFLAGVRAEPVRSSEERAIMRAGHGFSFFPRKRTPPRRRLETAPAPKECLFAMDLFCDLSPADRAVFEQQTELRTCRKGQILYSQEDRAEVLFLLKRGRVQLYRLTPSGKRLELAVIEPGAFFGEMPLVGETLRHTFAEATEDSLICVMSRSDITRLMRERSEVALRMIEVLSRRLALCEARLEELAYRSVQARIAAVLLRLSQGRSGEPVLITHQELGDMIGALRESVTKILDDFQRAELVELSRGRIILRDVAGLQARLEE